MSPSAKRAAGLAAAALLAAVPTGGLTMGSQAGDRVVRGGAWSLRPRRARSAFQIALEPEKPCHLVGFRVVCELGAAPR